MSSLPVEIGHVGVPPIKCQGIKTKLVPFILRNIKWAEGDQGRWVEPFLGSGVVAFNLAPRRALLADTNIHIVHFYQAIQSGEMSCTEMRDFLEREGKKLEAGGVEYYYDVRRRFNEYGSPFDFLFLNRSCFNGVMRFNRRGEYNVPFGHKPQRFAPAYVTKIINQIGWVAKQIRGKDWEFRVADWEVLLAEARANDFVYLDPPYIGRHTDYYQSWSEEQAMNLSQVARQLPCGFALSMWQENKYRKNAHLQECWSDCETRLCSHFYHVGSREELRNEMLEALMIKGGFTVSENLLPKVRSSATADLQLHLALEKRPSYEP